MLPTKPELYADEFARKIDAAQSDGERLFWERNLALASSLVARAHGQPQSDGRHIYQLVTGSELSVSQWDSVMRKLTSNIGPDPLPEDPAELLIGLAHGVYGYCDQSIANHPSNGR
jgi:hypothetical protein